MSAINPGTVYATSQLGGLAVKGAREFRQWWNRKPQRYSQRIHYIDRRLSKLENRRGEWKTHGKYETAASVTSTPSITMLTDIPQGDTAITREGEIIYLQSISFKALVRNNAAIGIAQNVRIILFFDTQQHGTAPTAANVLSSVSINQSIISHRARIPKGRIQIIFDQVLSPTPTYFGSTESKFCRYYKRFKGRKIYYIGTGDAEGDQGKGNLYMLLVSDKNASSYPTITWESQIKFTDM